MSRTSATGLHLAAPEGPTASDGHNKGGRPRGAQRGLRPVRWVRRFARDESGLVTVEAVFWIAFFFGLLALITDVSLAFFAKAEAFRIVQNGNRLYSVKSLTTTGAVETWIENSFEANSPTANATTAVDDVNDETVVATVFTIPIHEVLLFGAPRDWSMEVGSMHFVERHNP